MKMPIPKPWAPSHGPRWVLGITLTRPWPWAFFYGEPHERKDVENRKAQFPEVPPGTLLAIHTAAGWDGEAASLIRNRIPACAAVPAVFSGRHRGAEGHGTQRLIRQVERAPPAW
jgi:hypothetical protein